MDAVKQEIKQALESLGYDSFTFEIATIAFHRILVFVDDVRIGIYDLDRHTCKQGQRHLKS